MEWVQVNLNKMGLYESTLFEWPVFQKAANRPNCKGSGSSCCLQGKIDLVEFWSQKNSPDPEQSGLLWFKQVAQSGF